MVVRHYSITQREGKMRRSGRETLLNYSEANAEVIERGEEVKLVRPRRGRGGDEKLE